MMLVESGKEIKVYSSTYMVNGAQYQWLAGVCDTRPQVFLCQRSPFLKSLDFRHLGNCHNILISSEQDMLLTLSRRLP